MPQSARDIKRIRVVVHADARKEKVIHDVKGVLLIYTKEPARDNRANERICLLVARIYQVARSDVRIIAGHRAERKTLAISVKKKIL
ncbi:MAG: DUF167 domain-containing protein [Patescibacteria group bacterium]